MTLNEKEAIEYATAEAFLEHYNKMHETSFRITAHGDAPDVIAHDNFGNRLQLEIVLTEDWEGDIKAALGRSELRTVEALRRRLELARRDGDEAANGASSLEGNVLESLRQRLKNKMKKRYVQIPPLSSEILRALIGIGTR